MKSFGQNPEKMARKAKKQYAFPKIDVFKPAPWFWPSMIRFSAIMFILFATFLMFRGGCEGMVSAARGETWTMDGITGYFAACNREKELRKKWIRGEISAEQFFAAKQELGLAGR